MEPKLIASFSSGLNQYYKPWLSPEDSFETLENVYFYRGSVTRREGLVSLTDTPNPLAGPVMGLITREDPSTGETSLVAFSPTKAYSYNPSPRTFTDISGATVWTGTDSDFFWGVNYFDALFVTNDVDPVRYYNYGDGNWYDLTPSVNATTTLGKALIVVQYKEFMVALNTTENGVNFAQRARWSARRNPYATGTPPPTYTLYADSWRDDIAGNGGFIDASTSQAIVGCEFNADTLVVFFERSTWRLRFTGNAFYPFEWELVNSQLGSESTFGSIAFDQAILNVSRRGFVAANTQSVERIDEKIPDIAINMGDSIDELKKIHSAREYYRELALWTYSDESSQSVNSVLCYNYQLKAWSRFDLDLTCFGNASYDYSLIWDDADFNWDSPIAEATRWNSSGETAGNPFVLAGDADGNVYRMFIGHTNNGAKYGFDAITKRFMFYGEQGQKARLHYVDLYLTGTSGGEFTLNHFIDERTTPEVTRVVPSTSPTDARYVRVYLGSIGRTHQLEFTLSPSQAVGDSGALPWELQAMVFWVSPAGRMY